MTFFDVPPTEAPKPNSFGTHFDGEERSDWEDWEDEEAVTPIEDSEQLLFQTETTNPNPPSRQSTKKSVSSKRSQSTHSVHNPTRLKSRKRQKAQNARAGIKLVTDLTAFRRPYGTQNIRGSPNKSQTKFADVAALKALEGLPNSASVGNWNWLKRQKSAASSKLSARTPVDNGVSPADAPIMIGISMHPDALAARDISPNTAVVTTPPDRFPRTAPLASSKLPSPTQTVSPLTPSQQRSVWSPDTPNTVTTFESPSPRAVSSIYSQPTGGSFQMGHVPPVPAVPSNYRNPQKLIDFENHDDDDDDSGTPCTLFEEDGTISPRKSLKAAGAPKGLATVNETSNDWWEVAENPMPAKPTAGDSFRERQANLQKNAAAVPVTSETEWWKDVDEKGESSTGRKHSPTPTSRMSPMPQTPVIRTPSPRRAPPPAHKAQIVPAPSPRRTPSPKYPLGSATMASSSPMPSPARVESTADKAQILVEENQAHTPTEEPPPYSPPHQRLQQAPVRYRPHFPPGHPLRAQFPPSPGPVSPGMSRTMTSQGGINMTEIPLTQAAHSAFPERRAGTYVPQEHFVPAEGPRNRVERERRRHEKEEVVARRVGGFWKGRGCIPANGCYGRSGREGRKKRRICLGVIIGSILLLILTIVLAVVLSRKKDAPVEHESIFLNVSGFPPMPTGVLTVVGPEAHRQFDGCTEPATLWSCHLPKEQHESVAPFNSDQPTIILQIQADNSTERLWNVPDGDVPVPTPTVEKPINSGVSEPSDGNDGSADEEEGGSGAGSSSSGNSVRARAAIRARQQPFFAPGISPQPAPPSFQEMYFLGNTTDGIVSDQKAGEPTPFYVSLLQSADEPVGPNTVEKREAASLLHRRFDVDLPDPDLTEDGTGAPARLLPNAIQQPIRLYDRGLPTEHYGFYTYFRRTIYLRSVTALNDSSLQDDVPLDKDGGAGEKEANFLVTWGQTRFFVRLWTNSQGSKKLLNKGSVGGETDIARPGTMPYPVTFGLDTHGGDPSAKFVWAWPVDARQHVNVDNVAFLANRIGNGGSLVNPRTDENPSFGGFDGGTGGCACEWQNFLGTFGGPSE